MLIYSASESAGTRAPMYLIKYEITTSVGAGTINSYNNQDGPASDLTEVKNYQL